MTEYTWVIGLIVGFIIGKIVSSKDPVPPYKPGSMIDMLNELDALVNIEFLSVVEIPNKVRSNEVISDFEKAQTEVTKNVLNSLTTIFFKQANIAGLKRDYIITYITRRVTFKIIDYCREHNFTLKKK